MLILLWLFGAIFVSEVFGAARTIGWFRSLVLSLLLSPLLGLIIILFYPAKEDDRPRTNERSKAFK